jgi:predicted RNA binding protein YcfA (HicA-like mRNA interferase family)
VAELSPLTWTKLVRKLRKYGFDGPYQGGKHPYMIKQSLVLTIPNLHRRQISTDLLARILKQASISKDDWLKD